MYKVTVLLICSGLVAHLYSSSCSTDALIREHNIEHDNDYDTSGQDALVKDSPSVEPFQKYYKVNADLTNSRDPMHDL